MRKKSIVMVSYDYLPNIGGIAVYVHELSKALQNNGHKVTIVTCYRSNGTKIKREYHENMEIYRVPISNIKKISDIQYRSRMRNLLRVLQATREIDVIHWHTLNKDAKMMLGVEVSGIEVYTNHLSWFRMLFNQKKFKKIVRLIGKTDYIICPSQETKNMCLALYKENKCGFIPNGVNLKDFEMIGDHSNRLKSELEINESDRIIVTTNRMEPIKGMKYFIEAIPEILQQHPTTCFLVVGDGSEEKKLKEWIQKQPIDQSKVKFLGRKNNAEVRDILALADVYVQPSLMEGCSIAILEAMASGKPVIACNIGGNPDIVANRGNGLLIQEKSRTAIIEAVAYLFNNPQVASIMGEQGREKIQQRFNWTYIAEEVDGIYDFTIREKGHE